LLTDLDSADSASASLYNATVTVTYRGIEVTSATIRDYRTTTLEMNNIVKDLVNNDATLSKLLVAEDGPSNTMTLTALTDGEFDANDFVITATHTGLIGASANTLAAFNAANGLEIADLTALNAYLADTVNTLNAGTADNTSASAVDVVTTGNTAADDALINAFVNGFTQQIGEDGAGFWEVGTESTDANANVIVDGAGADVIALSTSGLDTEIVNLTADSEVDYIFNADDVEVNGMAGDWIITNDNGSADVVVNGTTGTIVLGSGADNVDVQTGLYDVIDGASTYTIEGTDGAAATTISLDDLGVAGIDAGAFETGVDTIVLSAAELNALTGASTFAADDVVGTDTGTFEDVADGGTVTGADGAGTFIFIAGSGTLIFDASGDTDVANTDATTDVATDDIIIATGITDIAAADIVLIA